LPASPAAKLIDPYPVFGSRTLPDSTLDGVISSREPLISLVTGVYLLICEILRILFDMVNIYGVYSA
jgi:hypothetical protein